MSDAAQELLALISRISGKCLLVSQAHVKSAVEVGVGENDQIDALWTESLVAQKNDLEWVDTGRSKVAVGYEGLEKTGGVSEVAMKQLGLLIHRMDAMIGIATTPVGTLAKFYVELQKTVNAYVTVFQETKAMPEFAGDDEG